MNKNSLFIAIGMLLAALPLPAQDIYNGKRAEWLAIAEQTQPALQSVDRKPVAVIAVVEDNKAFQGYKTSFKADVDSFFSTSMRQQSGIILDFGEHLTGFVSFGIEPIGGVIDGPCRLQFTFAEMPAEAVLPFDSYRGKLSRAWLQDETVTLTEAPLRMTIPRRVSFRYVKIDLLGYSDYSDFKITDLYVKATTSAGIQPEPLAAGTPDRIKAIDRIALNTLKECMQTVYEDGTKRDRRLWIGDLYLEALSNRYSFRNDSLTKRCLYLIAGLSFDNGVVPSNVFERPSPRAQMSSIFDYALIYNVALKNYLLETGDKETANDLWPVAKEQIKIPAKYIMDNGLIDCERAQKEWWVFFDWNNALDKQASLQACVIWAYKNTCELAKMLGKENEVSELPALINKMTAAARKHLFDKRQGVFVSGKDRQISYSSQAWMVLSGVANKKEGAKAFGNMAQIKDAVYPSTPYLYHYVVEAMIASGLDREAKDLVTACWGGMVEKGADTFWEVYNPENDFESPYNSFLVNSYCHAWSCTPAYFIRKYPGIFQK
jgi:hypothetical protein